VLVHCITRKGEGYPPAVNDDAELMHSPPAFDPATGKALPGGGPTWTEAFSRELVRIGAQRPDAVAITAAMRGPAGLDAFARAFPDRVFDVGIAEQHAVTSAAGMAMGGMHPIVAVYATFLSRAFDQLMMDCALHRLPVTFVLDRAGITGPDGPSHHGMWDLSLAGLVPGLRVAAPRDAATLAEELDEAMAIGDGPTMLRWPKGPVPQPVQAIRRVGPLDLLAEPVEGADPGSGRVMLVAVGALAGMAVDASRRLADQGISVTVVDPRWVLPVSGELVELARRHALVITVEDGGRAGGVGSAIADALAPHGVPVRVIALPQQFLPAGSRGALLDEFGLSAQAVARGVTEMVAALGAGGSTSDSLIPGSSTPAD
jgi:1-deoxy-D-xylulose-5-phosphate synthase